VCLESLRAHRTEECLCRHGRDMRSAEAAAGTARSTCHLARSNRGVSCRWRAAPRD
jgi:hypothetical protein